MTPAPADTGPRKYSSRPSGDTDMSTATPRALPGNSDRGSGSLHFPSRKTEWWIVSTPSMVRVKKNSRPSGVRRRSAPHRVRADDARCELLGRDPRRGLPEVGRAR